MLQPTLFTQILYSAVYRFYTPVKVLHSWSRKRPPIKHKFHINAENNTEHTAVFTIQQIYIIRQ